MMGHRWKTSLGFMLTSALFIGAAIAKEPPGDPSTWHIQDIYAYLGALDGELTKEEIAKYCHFLIDCQDPKTGNFIDKYGDVVYSVKAQSVLEHYGFEPKYPLGVCSGINEDWGRIDGKPVSEHLSPEEFLRWLDKIYRIEDAYAAGSSFGHFITPHVMNLKKAGKTVEDSPFVPIFKKWLLDHQGENGFWNRPDDPDYNGWNGVMKMDQALGAAKIKLPHQDRMIRTVLKYQNPSDGNFTAAGGCTNHNALHTLRQWSKRNDLLMWREIFRAMELFAKCAERRWDPATGDFRPPPGFDQPPQFHATELTRMAIGNVIDYCKILLDPKQEDRLKNQQARDGEEVITVDRIRSTLVRAMGIEALARQRIKEQLAAERERKYEPHQ